MPDRNTSLPDVKCTSMQYADTLDVYGYAFFVYGTSLAQKYGKVALNFDETLELERLIDDNWSLDDLLSKYAHVAIQAGDIVEK